MLFVPQDRAGTVEDQYRPLTTQWRHNLDNKSAMEISLDNTNIGLANSIDQSSLVEPTMLQTNLS